MVSANTQKTGGPGVPLSGGAPGALEAGVDCAASSPSPAGSGERAELSRDNLGAEHEQKNADLEPNIPTPVGRGSCRRRATPGSPARVAIDLARARAVAAAVVDPEIPAVTIADLGILRGVDFDGDTLVVQLTPTYSGCPAVLAIELAVEAALREAGFANLRIDRVLSPPWSTDEITEEGREKLRAFGIAPPARRAARGKGALLFADETVPCPRCGSHQTARVSEFGSTACKALWRCESCREPFDYFKCL